MSISRLMSALAVISLVLATGASAQRRSVVLESLDLDQLVKIQTVNHGIHVGRLTGLTGDYLFLRPKTGSKAVEVAAVDELWVRGTATRKGAVIGGVTGAILGALTSVFMSYAVCDLASCSVDAGVTGIGLLVGGAFGSVTGAVFGAMFGQWHRAYP